MENIIHHYFKDSNEDGLFTKTDNVQSSVKAEQINNNGASILVKTAIIKNKMASIRMNIEELSEIIQLIKN